MVFQEIAWEHVKRRREVSAAVFVATYKSSGCTTFEWIRNYIPDNRKLKNCRKCRKGKMFGLARPQQRSRFGECWPLTKMAPLVANFQTKRWQVARKMGEKDHGK